MSGWRIAYDWYLRAKLDARKKSSRFQLHRASLSSKLAEIVYPEMAASNIATFEMDQTIRALRRGFASTISRGSIWTPMESVVSDHHEEYLVQREVIFISKDTYNTVITVYNRIF